MERYDPLKIEAKWQKIWEKEKPYKATEKDNIPKMYIAEMFPYPSGAGLHVGHVRNFTSNGERKNGHEPNRRHRNDTREYRSGA
jgi:leucyl-tRNA synthetase